MANNNHKVNTALPYTNTNTNTNTFLGNKV